jgi:hypothetical protein
VYGDNAFAQRELCLIDDTDLPTFEANCGYRHLFLIHLKGRLMILEVQFDIQS